jgi:hypothetical protein
MFTVFSEQLALSVKTNIGPYNNLKILMIKMWIVMIPGHDLNKIWLKLKLISFSFGVTNTCLHLPI